MSEMQMLTRVRQSILATACRSCGRLVIAASLALALTGCGKPSQNSEPSKHSGETTARTAVADVSFLADDGLVVSGRYYRAEQPKAIILLFHQANSSMGEYATIAPRLAKHGFSVLAIDQRSGGSMFGTNQTASRLGKSVGYNDALHDLEATLVWSRDIDLPVIVWGSSYSAALVFKLAARHPEEVVALLAFSPGEYLGPGKPVTAAAAQLTIPVFVSVGSAPEELANARPVFAATGSQDKVLYVPKIGIHGSSTLNADLNAAGAEANWAAVDRFLASVKTQKMQRPPMKD